jgi:tubulin beta
VFFEEVPNGRCVPRSILVDLEPGVLDALRSNKEMGSLFNPDSFVHAMNGAGNNWAKGYFNEGAEIVENVIDNVRKQVEHCESLNSFQILHSIGGGTGSGFGSLLIEKLNEQYCDKLNINYSIFPGSTFGGNSDVVVEPYNSILTLNSLIESSHAVFTIENSALNRIC